MVALNEEFSHDEIFSKKANISTRVIQPTYKSGPKALFFPKSKFEVRYNFLNYKFVILLIKENFRRLPQDFDNNC